MAMYMIQASYTAEAWAAMTKNPEDRSTAVSALMEAVGGHLHYAYYTMGDYDIMAIIEAPNDTTTMSAVLAAASAGHVKDIKTTTLLSMGDGMEAMRRAGKLTYAAPKGKDKRKR